MGETGLSSSSFRERMVRTDLEGAGVRSRRVLDAFMSVPRELFVPSRTGLAAVYGNHPLPIGFGQTVSQPFIVAYMLELLSLPPGSRVLEIGTGSGYQTAILAAMGMEVVTVELIPELASRARRTIMEFMPDADIRFLISDGYRGWEPAAPYAGIIVSAAPLSIPSALEEQLDPEGGCLVLPAGGFIQKLVKITRAGDDLTMQESLTVRFVPLIASDDR